MFDEEIKKFISEQMKDLNTICDIMDKYDNEILLIPLICTMFDHICETRHIDKSEFISTIYDMIITCEEEEGNMYDET